MSGVSCNYVTSYYELHIAFSKMCFARIIIHNWITIIDRAGDTVVAMAIITSTVLIRSILGSSGSQSLSFTHGREIGTKLVQEKSLPDIQLWTLQLISQKIIEPPLHCIQDETKNSQTTTEANTT